MAAEFFGKRKDKGSRKVRKFLMNQFLQITEELGGLAAQDLEVVQCKAIVKTIMETIQNKEMKAELEGSFDAWVGFLHKQVTSKHHKFPGDGSDEPSPKRLCQEIQSSAQRESDEIQPFQDINLPSIGQLQSCSTLDDFCRAVTGLSLKDFHESIAKGHPSQGIEIGRKLLRAAGLVLPILSGHNQLDLFYPVLSCLQAVSQCMCNERSDEIFCSLQTTLNDLFSTVVAWLPMSEPVLKISGQFDGTGAPCDGHFAAMLIAFDLELLWIEMIPKDEACSTKSSFTSMYRRRAKERCKHCLHALANGLYLRDLFDFLMSGDYQACLASMGVNSGCVWMALFEGAWSLSELPSHKKALYAHRIALARLAKEMHPILYSEMYSTNEIGFQGHPVQQASQDQADPVFGMWASTQSGHPLLVRACKKGPMCVTRLLMKEVSSSTATVIAKSWAQRTVVPEDGLQDGIANHAVDSQHLFFTDTTGTFGAWGDKDGTDDDPHSDAGADKSDSESIDVNLLQSLPEAEGKASSAQPDHSDGSDIS